MFSSNDWTWSFLQRISLRYFVYAKRNDRGLVVNSRSTSLWSEILQHFKRSPTLLTGSSKPLRWKAHNVKVWSSASLNNGVSCVMTTRREGFVRSAAKTVHWTRLVKKFPKISQGSVETRLRCAIFSDDCRFIALQSHSERILINRSAFGDITGKNMQ